MTKKILYSIIICSILLPTLAFGADIQEAIERVTKEIDTRIENLNRTITRIESMRRLTDEQRFEITTPLKTTITELTALRTKVSQNTDKATTLADFRSVTQSYRVYALVMPRANIILAGERVNYTADLLITTRDSAILRLDALPAGKDVSAVTKLIGGADVKIADAEEKVEAAILEILTLQSDKGDPILMKSNLNTLKDARGRIIIAHQSLRDARKDIGDAIKLIREIEKN